MISLFHFVRLAVHNLRRGGQRVIVALLCITFGIMALVAMSMLAKSIESAVVLTSSQVVGGDLSLVRKAEETLRPADINQLNALQQSGELNRYTLIALSSSIMFHMPQSGEMHFIGNGLGIEPGKYPLAGSLTIGEPGNAGLPTLLQQAGDVVITRDIAETYHLKVGDPIILSDPQVGRAVEGAVRAIVFDTPNHRGDKIYYSIETAQMLANGQPVINTVIANTNQAKQVTDKLEGSGWSVEWSAGSAADHTANLWVIGLRGAGILGLLVGGIGIANTMQVLLRRRQHEIAIWKTLGYHAGDLRLIFSFEAGLLGLTGSLVGAGLGVLISTGLLELFRRTSTMLYAWTFSPTPPLMGILVGTLSTILFAYWAIVIASQTRPMALLRNEAMDLPARSGCQPALLVLLLAALFTALTSLIMGSVISGIAVLVAIMIGIAVLGGFFSVLLWLFARFLPIRRFPLARMALSSLRRGGVALVFATIALFIGVLSLSIGLVVTQISQRRISAGTIDTQGYNLTLLAAADQEDAVRQAIRAQNPQKVAVGYRTAVTGLNVVGSGEPVAQTNALLVGRSEPEDYAVSGADWGSQPDGVYAYKWANLKAGSQVQITFRDGTTKILTVVGTYDVKFGSNNLYPPIGLLMPAEGFTRTARPDALTYFVQVAPDQLSRAASALTTALPQATVINMVAYAARFMQSYQSLYLLPMVMAGLAMLAGFLLVANSVTLAMLDRRYDIGILKTVGYSRRQILTIFAVEYGLVGLLATGTGVFIVEVLLVAAAAASHLAAVVLLLNPFSLAVIAFCGIGLTLLTVLSVTWNPTRVSPVIVLNESAG